MVISSVAIAHGVVLVRAEAVMTPAAAATSERIIAAESPSVGRPGRSASEHVARSGIAAVEGPVESSGVRTQLASSSAAMANEGVVRSSSPSSVMEAVVGRHAGVSGGAKGIRGRHRGGHVASSRAVVAKATSRTWQRDNKKLIERKLNLS